LRIPWAGSKARFFCFRTRSLCVYTRTQIHAHDIYTHTHTHARTKIHTRIRAHVITRRSSTVRA
jgi:hypothetical protein